MSRQFALKGYDGHLLYTKRHITLGLGETLVEDGRATRHEDRDGTIWFLLNRRQASPAGVLSEGLGRGEVLGAVLAHMRKEALAGRPSCSVLSRAEVEAAVGLRGVSRTVAMDEDRRAERIRNGWQAEDLVERSQAKLECFRPGTVERGV